AARQEAARQEQLRQQEAQRQAQIQQQQQQQQIVQQQQQQQAPATGYYANCAQAKAAGVAPLRRGQPGYRPALDRDGDGIACEK
ncbi:MAG: excalibur calcium-binding domain-containing protein, partial [Actinomycetaceae bacterium]|nr:excalibur calcium-binding domain-containing protein [Actinomycetaceae bacterium]